MRSIGLLLALTALVLLAGCGSPPQAPADGIHVSCLREPSFGACGANRPGFYYDYRSDRCKRYVDGGCGTRPFETMAACVAACGGRPEP